MILEKEIRELVEEKIVGSNNFIVEISVKPGNKISILLDNDNGLSIDDCIKVSRYVENNMDREKEDFELSVSSPGLDRPLKILRQYTKYINKQVEVITTEGKKITGKLISADSEGISLEEQYKEKEKKSKHLIINTIFLKFNQIKETRGIISFK